MMNQLMPTFQQQFGKSCLCRATLPVAWKKLFMYRNVKDSPQSRRPISRTVTCAVVATVIEQSPHKSVWQWSTELQLLHLTMFDHKRDLVMKSFWPVLVIEINDTNMRLSQSMCIVVGMISGILVLRESSLFRLMCSLLQLPILKCYLGLNNILITLLRCKTTHHTWWWCSCNCQLYQWPIFLWWNC